MGSLICRRRRGRRGKGKQSKKRAAGASQRTGVMQLCHMDEIGFYVRHVDDKGFLWLNNAGGFDPRNLFSRRVLVCTEDGDFKGVMNPGGKPDPHLRAPRTAARCPTSRSSSSTSGMERRDAKKRVQVGDYVVMDEPFIEMGDKVVSKALDNRVACWLGIESVRKLVKSGAGHACEIVVAFTTQEEVGLRGAKTAASRSSPTSGSAST
jgi:putative aminopeptidase FrvX